MAERKQLIAALLHATDDYSSVQARNPTDLGPFAID
jgi:hypothetical protein